MPRIRCHYLDCAFLDEGFCTAGMVELDPDTGCKTYTPNSDAIDNDDWDTDTEEEELEEWDAMEEEGEADWDELDYDEEN
jgi:hypothetical protein